MSARHAARECRSSRSCSCQGQSRLLFGEETIRVASKLDFVQNLDRGEKCKTVDKRSRLCFPSDLSSHNCLAAFIHGLAVSLIQVVED